MLNLIPWKRNLVQRNRGAEESGMFPLPSFRRELDPLFGRLLDGLWGEADGWLDDPLRLEVHETDERFVIRAELPGVDPKDVDVQLSGDVLVLSGEKRQTEESAGGSHVYSERRYGSFRRALRLSTPVDPASVKAEHRNGVVTITLEKSAEMRPRRIPVTAG